MQLQFQGAARTVTGSMHVLTVGAETILLECGTYHGKRDEARIRNSTFPFNPAEISAVVLSHAHIDHSGNLPTLVKQGFHGPIYCTEATKDLCEVMLRDSGYIQERDAEFVTRQHLRKHLPPVEPVYTPQDVDNTIPFLRGIPYSAPFQVSEYLQCRYEDAGHILGSAAVALTLKENSHAVNLMFTGDLGRPDLPILRDPVFIDPAAAANYLVSESTYGGRLHAPVKDMAQQLLDPIRRACERKGKVIIPAFSVGRTQEIVYTLHNLISEGVLDPIPVFVDSPLSVNVTEVFRKHSECFDEETRAILQSPDHNDPFGFDRLTYVKTLEESKELNDRQGPFIVIAASGMCEAGRIVHHLANSVGDPKNMIMIVGYQAENTLGKRLVEKEPVVNIFGEPYEVKAEVIALNSFSGHADRNELLGYLGKFSRRIKQVFLVHGDPNQQEMLADGLHGIGFDHVSIPSRGDVAPLS